MLLRLRRPIRVRVRIRGPVAIEMDMADTVAVGCLRIRRFLEVLFDVLKTRGSGCGGYFGHDE